MTNPITLPIDALLADAISQASQGRPGLTIPIPDPPPSPAEPVIDPAPPPDPQAQADAESLRAANQAPSPAGPIAAQDMTRPAPDAASPYASPPDRPSPTAPAASAGSPSSASATPAPNDDDPPADLATDDTLGPTMDSGLAQPAGDLSSRLRGLGAAQGGAVIIYGDVHMPAIQNVQPALDKTQPPLVRGGNENELPQP